MSKDVKKMLVPRLRFSEFRNAGVWSVVSLNQLTTAIFDGTHQTPKYTEVGIPFFSVENIVSGKVNKFISNNDYVTATKKNKPEKGDVLITRIGNIGFSAVVDWDYEFSVYVTLAVVKKDERFNSHYLHSFMQSGMYQTEIRSKSLLNAVPCKINMDELRKTKVFLPTTKEQKKIADCLSSIDELISAQNQKIETLRSHKKGLMQQLFPREGKASPHLRFAEFRDVGEWEIKPFHKLFAIGNGKDYKHLSIGDIPVFGSGGYMLSVDQFLYDGESVCIGRKGTINNPMFLTGKFWTVDTLFYTHSFKDCLPKFIFSIFQNINWLEHNEAGGVPSLSKVNILKIEVAVPNTKEQQKIADCLSSIDELIDANSRKLESLKIHKKGLMQRVFPTAKEVEV